MRKLIFVCTLLFLSLYTSAQELNKAYRLFNNEGNEISFKTMVEELSQSDIILFGEQHNCPISHWMEYQVAKALHKYANKELIMGAEMLESDIQLILDEYMASVISPKSYASEARLWQNYETDYDNFVFFAKEHKIPFVATNIPRRYASLVNKKGIDALDSLTDEAKKYIAPLPIELQVEESDLEMFGAMTSMNPSSEVSNLVAAQAVKDATMAWFIAKNWKPESIFLHIHGSFHSNNKKGIYTYLNKYLPQTTIRTITSVKQEDTNSLDEENYGLADYYILVPLDMNTSY